MMRIHSKACESRRIQLDRSNRQGASLIEMMVVISMLGLVFTLIGTTVQLLLRSEKVVSQSLVMERTVARLANLFRDDVHQAESGVEIAEGGATELRLVDSSGVRVRYRIMKDGLTREIVEQNNIVSRDDFRLPDCHVRFVQDQQKSPGFVSLVIERPGVILQKNSQAPRPLRKLEILSCLDQKKRLLPDTGLSNDDVKNVRSDKEEQL